VGAVLAAYIVILVQAGVDWIWESTAVMTTGLVCVGVAIAAGGTRRLRVPIWARVAVPIVALGACLLQLPGIDATSDVRDSQAAFRAGDLAAAQRHASAAVDDESWAATPYVQRALVSEAQGRLRSARNDLLKAADNEPTNWSHRLLLSRLELRLALIRDAVDDFRRARELRPKSTFFKLLPFKPRSPPR
jgi:tetratricopeptide (TPR) repeat protein